MNNKIQLGNYDLLQERWRKLFADLAGITRTMYLAVFILKIILCTNMYYITILLVLFQSLLDSFLHLSQTTVYFLGLNRKYLQKCYRLFFKTTI